MRLVRKVGLGFALIVVAVAFAIGMITLVWLLWGRVMPQIWASGPPNLIRPGYWLFMGIWMLFVTIVSVIRGSKND